MDFVKLKELYDKMNEKKVQHDELSMRYKNNTNVVYILSCVDDHKQVGQDHTFDEDLTIYR